MVNEKQVFKFKKEKDQFEMQKQLANSFCFSQHMGQQFKQNQCRPNKLQVIEVKNEFKTIKICTKIINKIILVSDADDVMLFYRFLSDVVF